MNSTIQTIKNRRSVRKYLPTQIKEEELKEILSCAVHAPTGHNDQPWHFTVVQDKELIGYMGAKTKEMMSKSNVAWIAERGKSQTFNVFHDAPTVIVVSGNTKAYSPLTDYSAAIQNMLLAAESLDLGSCWVGLASHFFSEEEEVKKLNLPAGYKPYYAVCLGYKDSSAKIVIKERKMDVVNYIK